MTTVDELLCRSAWCFGSFGRVAKSMAGVLGLALLVGSATHAEAVESDDFNACSLSGNRWTLVDPLGDATVAVLGPGAGNARLAIGVPAGTNHDPFAGDLAPRVMQSVADEDFDIVARFESAVGQKYQEQGIRVEGEPDTFLRLETYSNGANVYVYAAVMRPNGSTTTHAHVAVSTTPAYLRVQRTGDQFIYSYAWEEGVWQTAAVFYEDIAVTGVGPYAGNYGFSGGAPAHTAVVDYFFDANSPVIPEDPSYTVPAFVISDTGTANGGVALAPDQPGYACGEEVTVTAVPDPGFLFAGWSGDIDGAENPVTIVMDTDVVIEANFVVDSPPTVISAISEVVSSDSAVVTWITDQPATTRLEFGETASYGLGVVSDASLKTEHTALIPSLIPGSTYHYRIEATNEYDQTTATPDRVFETTFAVGADPSGIVSDDFNACTLDGSVWSLVDPLGDSDARVVGAGSGDSALHIEVPAGPSHNPWVNSSAVAVLQEASDTDFAVEVKFGSQLTANIQEQGILVETDGGNQARFEFYRSGASIYYFAGTLVGGSTTRTQLSGAVPGEPQYLRVSRNGDQWALLYSYDGVAWTSAGSFNHSMTVNRIGPFAGNYDGGGNAPAHTAIVDYFVSIDSPVVPEDGGAVVGAFELTTTMNGTGTGTLNVTPTPLYCGQTATLEAVPGAGSAFVAFSGDIESTENPITVDFTSSLDVNVTFNDVSSPPPVITNISHATDWQSATIQWSTDQLATTRVQWGTTPDYELGELSHADLETAHTAVISGLDPDTSYHYRVSSMNSQGGQGVSLDRSFTTESPPVGSLSALYSDDFNACALDTAVWTAFDPLGDGNIAIVGAGTGDAHLHLSIPSGAHEPWSEHTDLRVMQPLSDADFSLDVKFDSPLELKYQEQGVIVENHSQDFLRIEFYTDGTTTYLFAGRFESGATTWLANVDVGATPSVLRINRQASSWTVSYSYEGSAFVEAATFTQDIEVNSIGPFAGNFPSGTGGSPPHTAIVDYFMLTGSDLSTEDVGGFGDLNILSTSSTPGGSLTIDPDQPTYLCGTQVELSAVADLGYEFAGWSGDVSDSASKTTVVTMIADRSVQASFLPDTDPPAISGVVSKGGATAALIRWSTDEPASGVVEYGTTDGYESGQVSQAGDLAESHSVLIEGLTPETEYHFRVSSADAIGQSSTSDDQRLTTSAPSGSHPSGMRGDDFNNCALDTALWDFVNPLGDASVAVAGAGAGDAYLRLAVPAGSNHEPWTSNTAPRIMQDTADTDFAVEVRFRSVPTKAFQEQGIVVEGVSGDLLRFDFYSNGSGQHVFAASIVQGVPTTHLLAEIPFSTQYMRVLRVGSSWTVEFSSDDSSWTTAGSFVHPIVPARVGPFAGNYGGGGSAPAYVAEIDYFSLAATPLIPEDVVSEIDGSKTLSVATNGFGSVAIDPDQPSYACGEEVSLTAVPGFGFQFDNWSGDVDGNSSGISMTMVADRSVMASFSVDVTPPSLQDIEILRGPTTARVSWTTDEPTTGIVVYGSTAAYEIGALSDEQPSKVHALTIAGLDPGTDYHVKIIAEDGVGLIAESGDQLTGFSQGPVIDVWYGLEQDFGVNGLGQPIVNILGNISDPDGIGSASYSVNDGPEMVLSLGPDNRRLDGPGDFNIDIPVTALNEGGNVVTIRATDALGLETPPVDVAVNLNSTLPGPASMTVDWSAVSNVSEVAQIVDGRWEIEGDAIRNLETGYDRLIAIGDHEWTDYEATVRFVLNSKDDYWPHGGPALGLLLHWSGHTEDGLQPNTQWWPIGVYFYYRWQSWVVDEAGVPVGQYTTSTKHDNAFGGDQSPEVEFGAEWVFKARVETLPNGYTRYSFKSWRADQAEPVQWLMQHDELTSEDVFAGSLLLVAHHVDVSWGTVTVTPLE